MTTREEVVEYHNARAKMNKRTFETAQLIEWGIHELDEDECEHILQFEKRWMDEFKVYCDLVFTAPDDGRFWRIEVAINNGAGWNSLTGTSRGLPTPRPEQKTFDAIEVEKVEVVETVWRVVQ